MRLALAFALAAALLAPQAAHAQSADHPFGLGFSFGFPNGFTGRYWLDRESAIQGTIGWSGWDSYWPRAAGPLFGLDYIYRFAVIQPHSPDVRFGFSAGAGAAFAWYSGGCYSYFGNWYCGSGAALFGRVPLGFSLYFPRPRIEVVAEFAPSIRMSPGFEPTLMGGLAGRFYF